jgi:pimeloyl-ACP methyl ester carboxylesterase
VEVVEVPFKPFPLPGYFARPSENKSNGKTLIALGGFDSSGEELYFQCAVEALKRGFNVLCFDGPGQTGVMRMNPKVPFRPDYEAVLKSVLDALLSRDDVDPDRVGLVGISFGGYLAPRSVAFEPRIKALIVSSPVTDWSLYMAGFFGEDAEKEPDFTVEELLELPDNVVPPRAKQMTIHCFRKFGVKTWYALLERLKEFRLTPEMMAAIRCPVLACIGEGEGDEPLRQCSEFTRFAGGPVTVHTFSVDWGADAHCQLNNLPRFGQVAYDWLNDVLT